MALTTEIGTPTDTISTPVYPAVFKSTAVNPRLYTCETVYPAVLKSVAVNPMATMERSEYPRVFKSVTVLLLKVEDTEDPAGRAINEDEEADKLIEDQLPFGMLFRVQLAP